MTDPAPSSALRDLRAHLTAPPVLAVQAGVALVLGLSGPFDTFSSLSLPARMAYWTAIVFGTYAIGAAVTVALVGRWTRPLARVLGGAAVIGSLAVVGLAGLNLAAFGWQGLAAQVTPAGMLGAYVVSGVVMALREVLLRETPPASSGATGPAILRRLPLARRGALVALSAEDHYVAVTTTRGRELVLMRLSDAIAEAEGVAGLQVHRSHWVALDQVRAARRQGDGAVLTLSDGRDIPVSRARLPAARAAGLLPG